MIDKAKVVDALAEFRQKERKLFREMIEDDRSVVELSHKLSQRDLTGSQLTRQDLSTLRMVWSYALVAHRINAFSEILENYSDTNTKPSEQDGSSKRPS